MQEAGRGGRNPKAAFSPGEEMIGGLGFTGGASCAFSKNHTSLLFTIKETVRWAAAAAVRQGFPDARFENVFPSPFSWAIHHKRSEKIQKVVGVILKDSPLGF